MQFSQTSLALWLRWVIASTAGLVLGFLLAGGLMAGEHENYKLLNAALGGALFGVSLAAVQMLTISQSLRMGRWLVASLLGYSLGFVFAQTVSDLLHFDSWVEEEWRSLTFFGVYLGVVSLTIGLPVGIVQWWSFRRGRVSFIEWVFASVLAIGASTFIAWLIAREVNTDQVVSGLEIPAIVLPAAAIFSTLTWLPVARFKESHTPQPELTAVPTAGLEDRSPVDE